MTFHRAYYDNPRLISTVVHRPPVARFHRRWMDAPLRPIEARRADDAAGGSARSTKAGLRPKEVA